MTVCVYYPPPSGYDHAPVLSELLPSGDLGEIVVVRCLGQDNILNLISISIAVENETCHSLGH